MELVVGGTYLQKSAIEYIEGKVFQSQDHRQQYSRYSLHSCTLYHLLDQKNDYFSACIF